MAGFNMKIEWAMPSILGFLLVESGINEVYVCGSSNMAAAVRTKVVPMPFSDIIINQISSTVVLEGLTGVKISFLW